MNMWDAGNIPMKTCCVSTTLVGALAADVEGSEEVFHVTGGLLEVHTTYLEGKCSCYERNECCMMDVPSIPNAFDLFVPRSVSLKGIHFISYLQRNHVTMDQVFFSRSVGEDGWRARRTMGQAGISTRWRQ